MDNNMRIAESLEECKQLADEWRERILTAENCIEYTGTAYYISNGGDDSADGKSPETAWQSINAYIAHRDELVPGDAVFFERGSTFRLFDMIKMVNGVSYGAYGKGPKPVLLGSEYNYAQAGRWTKYSDNIWKCTLEDDWDAGNMFFDEGKFWGYKRRYLKDLTQDFDFCHLRDQKALFLYLKGENPGERFYDIEIGRRFHIFQCFSSKDIHIDNICMKYSAAHGICLFNVKNVKVTNCEIGWIGGSYHSYTYDTDDNLCRFGNGIEDYGDCHGFTIKDCWVYQCYDAGITNQGSEEHDNILYEGNLLENSVWNIEFWTGQTEGSVITNMSIKNNFLRYGGYSWGDCQRTENNTCAQINCWINYWPNSKNINICGNIFEGKYRNCVWWRWTTTQKHPGLDIFDNTFYNNGRFRMNFGKGCVYAGDQEQMEKNILDFDRAPRAVRIFKLED